MSDITKTIDLLTNIQTEINQQEKALSIASMAMKETHTLINELVHFVRKMNEKPITQNERIILQHLYKATSILSNASADIKFGPVK